MTIFAMTTYICRDYICRYVILVMCIQHTITRSTITGNRCWFWQFWYCRIQATDCLQLHFKQRFRSPYSQ